MKTLHILRHAGDELAWAAVGVATPEQVRVVLVQDAVADAALAPAGVTLLVDPEYDQIMELIEWADKVVAW